MPILQIRSLLKDQGSEAHKVYSRYSLVAATPKPCLDRLIPGLFSGKVQHIFCIPCTNPVWYDAFLILVWPYKIPQHGFNSWLARIIISKPFPTVWSKMALPHFVWIFFRKRLNWLNIDFKYECQEKLRRLNGPFATSARYWIGIQGRSAPVSHCRYFSNDVRSACMQIRFLVLRR